MPNRKDSCEKDEDLNFHENMPYNIEIIEYEEFIPEEDINTTLSKSYPPKYIDKEQNKIEKNTFLSSENVKEAIFNKKENENQEFYIKHLINEVKKSSTCAKSYREENEALKGKINFLNNKMSVKDQKIEEITNLLKNNNENLNTVVLLKFLKLKNFDYQTVFS